EQYLLSRTPSQQHGNLILKIFALLHQAIALRQRLRNTKSASARENGNLVNRIAILYVESNRDVARFVDGRCITLIFVDHESVPFCSHQDSIASIFNVLAAHRL